MFEFYLHPGDAVNAHLLGQKYRRMRKELQHIDPKILECPTCQKRLSQAHGKYFWCPPCKKHFVFRTDGSYLYLILSPEHNMAKIGYATSPISNFRSLQTGCPNLLFLRKVVWVEHGRTAEREAHKTFKKLRVRGEWFIAYEEEMVRYYEWVEGQSVYPNLLVETMETSH